MRKIDLHTHSTYSDGTLTPKELIEYAKVKSLSAVALTDHDTIDGLEEAEVTAKELGIELVNGVEISIGLKSNEFHILGLMFDRNSKILQNTLKQMQNERQERNIEMIKLFKNNNVDIEYEELIDIAKGSVLTRAHFAKLLVKKGYVKDNNEAFERFLSASSKTYIHRKLFDPKVAIQTIHEANGIAILAHPLRYGLDVTYIEKITLELKGLGLDGIEAIYSSHKPNEESYLRTFANTHNLKISGGSDFHGDNKPNIDLGIGFGKLKIPSYVLDNLKL